MKIKSKAGNNIALGHVLWRNNCTNVPIPYVWYAPTAAFTPRGNPRRILLKDKEKCLLSFFFFFFFEYATGTSNEYAIAKHNQNINIAHL